MSAFFWFLLGTWIGAAVGVFTVALFVIGKGKDT
jgi:hypothetical protein